MRHQIISLEEFNLKQETMRLKQLYRGVVAGLGLLVFTNACAPNIGYVIVRASSDQQPAWIENHGLVDSDKKVFVGLSRRVEHERDARDEAMQDAMGQIAQYTGVAVSQVSALLTKYQAGDASVNTSVSLQSQTRQQSDSYIYSVDDVSWYVVEYTHRTARAVEPAFEAHVRVVMRNSLLQKMQAEKTQAQYEQSALANARARQVLLADVKKSTAGVVAWQGDGAHGVLDWYAGALRVTARGFVDKKMATSRVQLESLAILSARQLAYAGLSELVHGVEVRSETSLAGPTMGQRVVTVRQEGMVRGKVLTEKVFWDGDEPVGEVTVESTMQSIVSNLDYTRGIIIDARDSGFAPDLLARVVAATGEEILGPSRMRSDTLGVTGTFLYAASMSSAVKLLDESAITMVLKATTARKGVVGIDMVSAAKVQVYLGEGRDSERVPVIVVF